MPGSRHRVEPEILAPNSATLFAYYEVCRTHLSLEKDSPVSRSVEPPTLGHVIQIPKVGGLHHLYTRKAA
jgi:hypothetical protein